MKKFQVGKLGWKIPVGKWMKIIGLISEKIWGQKTDVKNSGWKINGKNWTSRWKNSRLAKWREKLKISLKFYAKFLKFLQNCPNFSDISMVFPKSFATVLITWHNEAHWHISGHDYTRWLEFWQCEYDTQSESPSCIVSK